MATGVNDNHPDPDPSCGPDLVGPFDDPPYRVTVDGYGVPYLAAGVHPDTGEVTLSLDGRFGMGPVSREEFDRWAWLLAHAMAIAAGYSCHGKNSVPRNIWNCRLVGVEFQPDGGLTEREEFRMPPPNQEER